MSDINPEDLHPPKKGGAVEQARMKKNAEQAQLEEHNSSLAGRGAEKYPVPVFKTDEPDSFTAKTPIVQTGGAFAIVQLLGRDETRKRAVILAIDEPIVLAVNVAGANDSRIATNTTGLPTSGFVLPVNVPFVVYGSAEIWAAATSSQAARVSVWAETFREGE